MKKKEENAKIEKSNTERIRKLNKESEKITDAVVKQKTTRLLVENTKQVDAVVKELEKRELNTRSQIEDLQGQIDSNNGQDTWIDWVQSFGTRIQHLRESNLPDKEKTNF